MMIHQMDRKNVFKKKNPFKFFLQQKKVFVIFFLFCGNFKKKQKQKQT